MKQKLDKEDFVKLPQYTGGSKALRAFVDRNVVMPESAIVNKIKDFVFLEYQILHDGSIGDIKILKSTSEDCDKEAIRVVKLLKYVVPKNRGMKVFSTFKIKIYFDYSRYENKIIYEVKNNTNEEKSTNQSYFYTLNI
jgi:TonB family protein